MENKPTNWLNKGQRKAGFLGPDATRVGCSWRTGSAGGFRGGERLRQPLVHRPGWQVGYFGLLPARSAGAGQVTARSEKRKSKRVIHHSALPHLQSHAAFTHSQPRSALTLSAGAVRTPLRRPERPPGLCGCGRSVGNWGGVWGLGLKKAKQLSPEIPPLLGVSRYFPGKQLCLVVNPSCAECKDPCASAGAWSPAGSQWAAP